MHRVLGNGSRDLDPISFSYASIRIGNSTRTLGDIQNNSSDLWCLRGDRTITARKRCGLKEDVVTRIEKGMLRWFGHLERMNEYRLTKKIYRMRVCDEKDDKGHPGKS
ncbi:hypothetical protein EVAR_972_1 [Eumeta japonica]|uniref:Uncharacterized protein n=1 Tax=Eumeta variegata TaxID=151549 RepID=A0A4C1SGC6_EUMVA|nr:hypothetical protein EVAR_972_1 [Eumeta japonica]